MPSESRVLDGLLEEIQHGFEKCGSLWNTLDSWQGRRGLYWFTIMYNEQVHKTNFRRSIYTIPILADIEVKSLDAGKNIFLSFKMRKNKSPRTTQNYTRSLKY